jgi:tetratricopeptide (TPR) repeat protein
MHLLEQLNARNANRNSSTVANVAPEEQDRIPILDRGVSLRFLRTLVAGLSALGRADIDTEQVLSGVHPQTSSQVELDRYCIKALTLHYGTSFVETCGAERLIEGEDGKPFFGRINAFVTYSRRGEAAAFAKLVAALEAVRGSEGMFFFIDVLVCAQHRRNRPASGTCPKEQDMRLFRHVIEHSSCLFLYATPITAPPVLRRAWCLYEVMTALELGIAVEVVLSVADQAHLARASEAEFDAILRAFTRVDSATAEATELTDLQMIAGWILETFGPHGFAAIDEAISNHLRGWLINALERIATGACERRLSAQVGLQLVQLEQTQALLARALAHVFETALGSDHPSTAATLHNLACVHKSKGNFVFSRVFYERALQIYEAELGADHPSTATTVQNLANVHESNGDYAGAQLLYERVLAVKEKALGPDHPSTASTVHNLANLHKAKGDYQRAQLLYERALATFEAALGTEHPHTKIARDALHSLSRAISTSGSALSARSSAALSNWELVP